MPATLIGLFLAELLIMLLLDLLNLQRGILVDLLDAALLAVFFLPVLYLVVLLPVATLTTRLATASADARFRAVVEAASDAIIIIDHHSRIHFVNPAATKLTGYSTGELEGTEMAILVPEEQREQHRKGLQHYIETGESRIVGGSPVEMEVQSKDGERIPVRISLSAPMSHEEGRIVAVIGDLRQSKRVGLYEALLPVCCVCGVIRDDTGVEHGEGEWVSLEDYIQKHAAARFSHGFCPECFEKYQRSEGMLSVPQRLHK
ncbi:MAG: PAS domain S-box protein [Acidobacteria bacterium]|nr:PAS domain S-box protein [Acidobacteriota bacterium]